MASKQCSAVAAAKEKSGLSYPQIATKIGTSEQHVIDIVTGKTKPTANEFQQLAQVLNISTPLPHDAAHTA